MHSTRLVRGSFIAALLAMAGLTAAQAADVTLKVVNARTENRHPKPGTDPVELETVTKGVAITVPYKFLVNIDNTGQTIATQRAPNPGTGCSPQDADYPNSCLWTSIAGTPGHSPVYTQGDSANPLDANKLKNVKNGRYLVSVLADGYKLDGRHFTVAGADADGHGGTVTWEGKLLTDLADEVKVELQPWPLPDAQIQAAVFEDISPVNSAPDVPAEHGLAGFQGHITDYLGEVTTDVYGNPLCTTYSMADGKVVLDAEGAPTVDAIGGRCLSKCYVVDGGKDIGIVAPIGWINPNTPSASSFGRCPVIVEDANGNIPTFAMYTEAGVRNGSTPATAVIEGKLKIPYLGPNRYALSATPPDGSGWVQTTTLEGNHDWDAWVMEGATGLDTEFVIAGEPFPAIIFGYVPAPGTPSAAGTVVGSTLSGTATISGVVEAVKIYVPTTGGIGGLPGEIWGGLQGAKLDKPIENPWVTLTDLDNGDTIVWAGQGDANGKFSIPNVPAGTYTLTWWDEPQNEILDLVNVTVKAGENIDMGILPLAGWWTVFDGYVFNDANRNGVMDTDEQGLSGYTLTMRKRENSLMDRGTTVATTDSFGYYKFEAAYPMTQWLVMEAYDDLHYTTGVTYQADNQPDPTTLIGPGVDVSVHPIIGLSGRLDWGKHIYDATGRGGIDPRNGGIVGTVTYDTTRNELDPRYAAVEDWQPSISDLTVKLWSTVPAVQPCMKLAADGSNSAIANCDASGRYALDPATKALARGNLLNTYLTEAWQRPNGCVARGLDGTPLMHGRDEQVLPLDDPASTTDPASWKGCIEAPLMGVQFFAGSHEANDGVAVDGNYGFGDGCFGTTAAAGEAFPRARLDASDPANPHCVKLDPVTGNVVVDVDNAPVDAFSPLPAADYLVQVDLKSNQTQDGSEESVYKVTREEDINIGNGDGFVPAVPPSACAGALHSVDVAGLGTDGLDATANPTFVDIGGSPYEGMQKPLCDVKLVTLSNGKSIAPAFNLYTDVPLPGRHWFIVIDDLNFSSNPKSVTYGEKAGMSFVPVGIYDYTDRLIKTVESDYNGLADVLLPSTNRINCPTPSGVCGNLYRYVGNDPGVPGRLNPNYDPNYRTIAAEFEVLPGLIVPADLAPTQVGVTVQLPGAQSTSPVACRLDDAAPQLYRVSKPYVLSSDTGNNRQITIDGLGFGALQGSGAVYLVNSSNAATTLTPVSWSNKQIVVSIPTGSNTLYGPNQLMIRASNGQTTISGISIHVLSSTGTQNVPNNANTTYNPRVFEVGPGRAYQPAETLPTTADHAIQNALNAAATWIADSNTNQGRGALVVVYPNNPTYDNPRQNPRGAYYENLIISSRVKLQGVGSGSPDGSVQGSIIDGGAFAGDSPVATDWYTQINAQTVTDAAGNAVPAWSGNATINDGAVISVYVPSSSINVQGNNTLQTRLRRQAFPTGTYNARTAPSIDGFDLRGGDQQGFPGNINAIGGGATGQPGGLTTQGGAVFANAYATNLQITNNVVQNNGGAYGTIRIGTPDIGDNNNDNVVIAYNRIINNAGTNQAGGVGLFEGADQFQVKNNDICGNFSAEYGGGISVVGRSSTSSSGGTVSDGQGGIIKGRIQENRIYFNRSYDEGGGIMIAGALPAITSQLSGGAGPVDISGNLIQSNLANDDGGGIRFLMSGNYPMNVFNNIIANNISTHEGGGISINDAPDVIVFNNTIMKNITTATAITSSGQPAPAGLSTSQNSDPLMKCRIGQPNLSVNCNGQPPMPSAALAWSDPLLFNNIFWDNRAGTRADSAVTGIGNLADCTPANCDHWDLGVADMPTARLSPTDSIIQQLVSQRATYTDVTTGAAANIHTDPAVKSPYDVGVTFNAWRNNPAFLGAIMISADLPPNLQGDYHLQAGSAAINLGSGSKAGVSAPSNDIDIQNRSGNPDAGADEFIAVPVAVATITAGPVSFGNVYLGAVSTQTLTVRNTGTATLTGIGVAVTGPFSRTGGSCVATLNASSNCTITLQFAPTIAGAATGSATVTANVPVANSPVTLTGTGLPILPVHLGALVGSSARGFFTWTATVTITVHNSNHQGVSGVTVTGSWSNGSGNGFSGIPTTSCTTNNSGQCQMLDLAIANTRTGMNFSVINVSGTGYAYQSAANDVSSSLTVTR